MTHDRAERLTLVEVAAWLGVPVTAVQRAIANRRGPRTTGVGRGQAVHPDDLLRWAHRRPVTTSRDAT